MSRVTPLFPFVLFLSILACKPVTPATPASVTPTPVLSSLEAIGLVQAYLETRFIWEGEGARTTSRSSTSTGSSGVGSRPGRGGLSFETSTSTGSTLRETDCRSYLVKQPGEWESSRHDDGSWIVKKGSYEWRLFQSGVITTGERSLLRGSVTLEGRTWQSLDERCSNCCGPTPLSRILPRWKGV